MTASVSPCDFETRVLTDAYDAYARLRASGGHLWDHSLETHFFGSYELVSELLSDPRLRARGRNPRIAAIPPEDYEVVGPVDEFFSAWLVFSNPPRHRVVRNVLSSYFRSIDFPRLAKQWRARFVERDSYRSFDGDIIRLSTDMSEALLGALFEVPDRVASELVGLSNQILTFLASPWSALVESARETRRGWERLRDFYAASVESSLPPGTVLSVLQVARKAGEISDLEFFANVSQLVTGLVEPVSTTAQAILLELAQRSDLVKDLANRDLNPVHLVDEAIRYCTPFHFASRRAAEDLEAGGAKVACEQRVVLIIASANRDESRWEHAEVFDPRRLRRHHLAFGQGIHLCLGAQVARTALASFVEVAAERDLAARVDPRGFCHVPSFGVTRFGHARHDG